MFKEARIKLTAYYLIIIMAISLVFSVVIYKESTFELDRIERFQKYRSPILNEIRDRIITRLFYFNLLILGFSGTAGYYLAGKTLDPIQKNMEEQKDFVSSASHELRTPLTALTTELEIAIRDPEVKNKEILKSNLEEVNKMKRLTDYLLRLNKMENGLTDLEFKKVDLAEVSRKVIGKNKIQTDLDQTIINGNEDSIFELVSILLDNAKKYSKNIKDIKVATKNKTLIVGDKGVGIPESDLPHIFERFYRGDKAHSEDGYGLGLSIAKQIADLHGAKIKVESKVGIGSTFKVIFS